MTSKQTCTSMKPNGTDARCANSCDGASSTAATGRSAGLMKWARLEALTQHMPFDLMQQSSGQQATGERQGTGVEPIDLVLPYPVSSNRYWRSFVPRGHTRAIVTLSDEAKLYKKDIAKIAKAAGLGEPITGRYFLWVRLYPNRPLDWKTRQRKFGDLWDDTVQCIDLGNAEKVLSDALQGTVFGDDKKARRILLDRLEPDERGARVEVTIVPIALKSPQMEFASTDLFGG